MVGIKKPTNWTWFHIQHRMMTCGNGSWAFNREGKIGYAFSNCHLGNLLHQTSISNNVACCIIITMFTFCFRLYIFLSGFWKVFFPSSTMLVKTCNTNSSSSICFSTPFSSSIYLESESFNSSRTFWHDPRLIVEDVFASLCLTFCCNGNNFYCRGLRHVFCLTLKIVYLSTKLLVKAWTLHSSSTT